MIAWRIYYADGSTFDNTQGNPEDTPRDSGVVCIIQRNDKHNREVMSKGDYYYYRTDVDAWFPADLQGLLWQFRKYPATRTTLSFGETLTDERFDALHKLASNDSDFLQRAGGRNIKEQPISGRGETSKA